MSTSRASICWLLFALAIYLGGALWALHAVLSAPARMLPHAPAPSKYWDDLVQADQSFSVARITHAARALTHAPWRVMEGQHCWPMPRAATLGEHMIGEGLLGIVPDLLFREPILTYNVVLILLPCLAGFAMYALVLAFTGSRPAALVAGLLFALHPARLGNAAEPYWMGNHWTPLALLFAHRLFTRGRWSDALGLALFTSLQLLDSFYPIIAFVLVGGPYALALFAQQRHALRSLAPKLLTVAVMVAAVGWCVFVPYLQTRATWGTLLSGRVMVLYSPGDLAFGGGLYPGTVLSLLALVGIVDRLRRPRSTPGYDHRIPFVVGGGLVLWAVLAEVPVPFSSWRVPSLLTLARGAVPGLDAVRVGRAVASGFYLVCALLAGFGVRVLVERSRARMGYAVSALLVVAAMLEVLHPRLATATFGRAVLFEGRLKRPPDDVLALYGRARDGAVLDLPANVYIAAEYVLLSAYHGHPTVACYGSFESPLSREFIRLAERLPADADAGVALHALGIRTVVTHYRGRGNRLDATILPPSPHLRLLGQARPVALYDLVGAPQVDADLGALTAGGKAIGPVETLAGAASLAVSFRNGSQVAYRHPDPIAPTTLRAQWFDKQGTAIAESTLEILLPLALAPGETTTRELAVAVPSTAGSYRLVLSVVGASDGPLETLLIQVK